MRITELLALVQLRLGYMLQDAATVAKSQQKQQPKEDQSQFLARIAEQVAESTRAEREAACQKVREACDREHSRKRKQLEDATLQEREKLVKQHESALAATEQERQKLVKQHEAAMAAAEEMAARRIQDSKQFVYIVRGKAETAGSVPRQIFEAEPNSVLNKVYNGEWAHAVDEQGRACINSNPAHWPLILDWLSFGSVPSHPTASFIAECKYWQLDNLLGKLEAQKPPPIIPVVPVNVEKSSSAEQTTSLTHIKEKGRNGFQLECEVHDFVQRFRANQGVEAEFRAFGSIWAIDINGQGSFLNLKSGPPFNRASWSIAMGMDEDKWVVVAEKLRDFLEEIGGWGFQWTAGRGAEKVQQYPYVNLKGSLHVTIWMLFQKQGSS